MTRSNVARIVVQEGPTIASMTESYLTDMRARDLSPMTLSGYTLTLGQFDAFLAANNLPREVMAVTRGDVRSFMRYLLEDRHDAPGTAHTKFSVLRAFFNFTLREGEIVASPMAGLTAPKVPDVPVAVLTDEQLRAILATCAGPSFQERRDNAILRLLLDTGMRRAECGGLKVEEVNIAARVAVLIKTKGRRPRVVRFGNKTAQAIDRYLRVRRGHPLAYRDDLWLTQIETPVDGRTIGSIVEKRGRQAGITTHAHMFRHTYAHHQLSNGMQEGDLMQQGGWRTRDMLARYGAKLAVERSHEAYDRVGAPGDRL